MTDGRTDGHNYDSQDRASIAASRGNNNHSDTVSVHFKRASVFTARSNARIASAVLAIPIPSGQF